MRQLSFFPDNTSEPSELRRTTFSHAGVCPEDARIALEDRYGHLLKETDEFNR